MAKKTITIIVLAEENAINQATSLDGVINLLTGIEQGAVEGVLMNVVSADQLYSPVGSPSLDQVFADLQE